MECPLCGEPVAQDDLFCGNCGYNLRQDEPEPKEPDSPTKTVDEPLPLVEAVDKDVADEFAIPEADETPPKKGGLNWRTLIIVAFILLFVMCCCSVVGLMMLGMMAE